MATSHCAALCAFRGCRQSGCLCDIVDSGEGCPAARFPSKSKIAPQKVGINCGSSPLSGMCAGAWTTSAVGSAEEYVLQRLRTHASTYRRLMD